MLMVELLSGQNVGSDFMHCLNMQCYDGDENDLPNELLYESYLGWLDLDPKMHLAFNLENYFVHWPNHEKDVYMHALSLDRSLI